jgi:dTDP-4-amino-4,6-dideoxygalactose transaminase
VKFLRKPIFTSLSPNAEKDDGRLALLFLLRCGKRRKENFREELERKFRDRFGCENGFAFESGRSCLYAILSSIGLREGDEVLFQSYTCVAVPNAVLWAGGKPVYVDIDERAFNMSGADLEKKITPRSRALIVQHTFGSPADMDGILLIAKRHRLFVIEDCAHAFGAAYKGKEIGTFGDAAFFSFGRDKVISSVFGGIAVVRDSHAALRLKKIYDHAPPPPFVWTLRQLLHPVITSVAKDLYHIFGFGKILFFLSRTIGLLSREVAPAEKKGEKPAVFLRKMPDELAALALHQLEKLARFNEHRRAVAGRYDRLFAEVPDILLPVRESGHDAIFLRYTVKTPRAGELIRAARRELIFLGDWYRQGVAPAGTDYKKIGYDPALCPAAERAAGESLNLPTDIHISEEESRRMAHFIISFLHGH